MAIFNSYVSLPEGNRKNHEKSIKMMEHGNLQTVFFPLNSHDEASLIGRITPKSWYAGRGNYTGVIKYGEIPEEHEHFKGKSSHYFWFSSHGALLTIFFGYSAGIRQFNITGYIDSSQTEVYIVEAADTFAALVGESTDITFKWRYRY